MKYPILVTAAIIQDNGKYLITQRPANSSHGAKRWEFPGGKVDFGEDLKECLKREIYEELGIKISVGDFFGYSSHVYGDEKHVILFGFHCKCISGKLQKHGIEDYAWVAPEEMCNYDITEADLPFVEKLAQAAQE